MTRYSALGLAGVFLVALGSAFLSSCGGSAPTQNAIESTTPAKPGEMNAPLTAFSQEITSSVKSLRLKPSETTELPVIIRNAGKEALASYGKYPVNISYKWFDREKMLPIEGERSGLPAVLKPNESTNVNVKVVAPPSGKSLTLKVTLVQEGVEWFMSAGARTLDIPVTLVP
jgi:hypothetical protein